MTSALNGLPLRLEPPPLRIDAGDRRASRDLVVQQSENGMTPEDRGRVSCDELLARSSGR